LIIVYHLENTITDVRTIANQRLRFDSLGTISNTLQKLANQFPDKKIVWCHSDYKELFNIEKINTLFHHNKMMLSYRPGKTNFLGAKIGYVEESPFIKINKKVRYPTWQMSSTVGVVHASVLNAIKDKIHADSNFDYYLCSLAKTAMPAGLLCYSEPQLLKVKHNISSLKQASEATLFRFTKEHYRKRWVFLLLLNNLLYDKKFPFLSFIKGLSYKNISHSSFSLEGIAVQSSLSQIDIPTIDVIIPTIGRKEYLYEVLKDFSKQTLLPLKIIIVEQNPIMNSSSELDYIYNEKWPFEIQHIFTHQAGACNARNLALKQTKSEWVFLADDDIKIKPNFFEKAIEQIKKYSVRAVSFKCSQLFDNATKTTVFQWSAFGSGCSIVRRESIKDCYFRKGFEFGFGEDSDFGIQLRNQGQDILYFPEPEILHLKAPIGGFRTKPAVQWQSDIIQPKPSPTVMLYKMLHNTSTQTNSYKTILFFKYYKQQRIKNPIRYYFNFQKQWERSVLWAKELKKQNEV